MVTVWKDPGTRLRRMKLMAPTVLRACALTGEVKERLMALCYRESLCTFALNPPGDVTGWGDDPDGSGPGKPHAFGPFQIDHRYHLDFIKTELGKISWCNLKGLPYDPISQATYACNILRDNRWWLKKHVPAAVVERATYAAYNAGPAAVSKAIASASGDAILAVDRATTGKDYSGYIFGLASLLQKPEYQWIWND